MKFHSVAALQLLICAIVAGAGLHDRSKKNVPVTVSDIEIPGTGEYQMAMWMNDWLLVQNRAQIGGFDDSYITMDRLWSEYRSGFGQPTTRNNYWFGLEPMHRLTTSTPHKLRVEIYRQTDSKWYWAEYASFRVGSEEESYALHVDGYSGDAGDALVESTHEYYPANGRPFSTSDHGDPEQGARWAKMFGGAWWFGAISNINKKYFGPAWWGTQNGATNDVTRSRMFIMPA